MITFQIRNFSLIVATLTVIGGSFKIFEYDDPGQLYAYLEETTKTYPHAASLIDLGLTFENRPIYCLKISKGDEPVGTIIAEFGVHAREWGSHASATHVIHELLNNETYDEVATKITWYIVPLLNPDGFKFSKTNNRYWRKNRRLNPSNEKCAGVDVNRNFPVEWPRHDNGSVCDEDYGGPAPSSENETMAIEHLFKIIPNGTVDLYISVHTDAQCIILPYAYTRSRPPTYAALYNVAEKMKNAMEEVEYPKYDILQASQMYEAYGTVFDWVYDQAGVPLVFTLELPFKETLQPFKVNQSEMVVLAKQCIAALEACALEIIKNRQGAPVSSTAAAQTKSNATMKSESNENEPERMVTGNTDVAGCEMVVAVSSLTAGFSLTLSIFSLINDRK